MFSSPTPQMPFSLGRFTRCAVAVASLVLAAATSAAAQAEDAFNPGANGAVYAMAVQPDGKILVGGGFTGLGAAPARRRATASGGSMPDGIARHQLQSGRERRSSMPWRCSRTGRSWSAATSRRSAAVAPARRPRNHIGRLNPDGSLDTTFNPGANSARLCHGRAAGWQDPGRRLLHGARRRRPARRRATASAGSTPTAHSTPASIRARTAIRLRPGRAAGWQDPGRRRLHDAGRRHGTTPRNRIGRLNADGSLDAHLQSGRERRASMPMVGPAGWEDPGRRATSRRWAAAARALTPRNRIGRLNADGTVDADFNPGANSAVNSLALQTDGQSLLEATFTRLGGGAGATPRLRIGRLNADGSLDATFDPGATQRCLTASPSSRMAKSCSAGVSPASAAARARRRA